MKNLFFCFLFTIAFQFSFAGPGDTNRVTPHNATHLGGYGIYDRWGVFPDGNLSYHKVLMRYTLGCPSSGCSEWDYTTQVFARRPTGNIDSNLVSYPNFTVNGQQQDSLHYSLSPTFQHFWNGAQLDSTANPLLTIIFFNDPNNPTVPTDTISGYLAGYQDSTFDNGGSFTGFVTVPSDSSVYLNPYQVYNVFEVIEDIEIGRVITPYNGNVPNSWKWTYTFDITDYLPLLKDSVEIRVLYSGYQNGFTVKLDFEFIEGTPLHDVTAITQIYQGSFPYGDVNNSIENYLTDTPVAVQSLTDHAKFRYWITGHGFGGNENCAEFCPKNYYLKVNGAQVGTNLVWNEQCGLNPIYPQAGTWLYDRANWCPGARVYPFDHDITNALNTGQTNQLNVDMQPFVNINNNFCSYTISGQLFEYGPNNFQNDVEMLEIISPNNDKNFGRINPVCDNAIVIIRNTGKNALTSATIQFGVEGGNMLQHQWTGNLPFLGTDTVNLSMVADWNDPSGNRIFSASVSAPNGIQDEYSYNNMLKVSYDLPATYPDSFVLVYKTNFAANENSYTIKDAQGNVVYSRSSHSNNTIYRDTLHFAPGCYLFEFNDSDKDGISWWANNDGAGYVRFQKIVNGTQIIRNFNPDFGTKIFHYFTVGGSLSTETYLAENGKLEIFPNPSAGQFSILPPLTAKEASLEIKDATGRTVLREIRPSEAGVPWNLSLENQAKGLYMVEMELNGQVYIGRLILSK